MKQSGRVGPIPPAQVHFPAEDLEELTARLREILQSGRLTLGPYTENFEKGFATLHQRNIGVAVNSGTSALEIILRAMRIQGGDVIVPTNTFAATAFAVLHSGNRLVLADVDGQMFLDPEDVQKRITPDTKAVIAVHIGGRVVPSIESLAAICEAKRIPLIEDAAHAHGSRLLDRFAGTFGVAAAFSFYPTKVITSGEGGMVVTDDEELAAKCRVLRDQGKAGFGQNLHTELGYNWRMSEIHASIGLSQLKRLHEFIESRRKIAAIYDKGLASLGSLESLRDVDGMYSNYYKYIALLSPLVTRADLKATLKQNFGISLSGEVYDLPLHLQPVFRANLSAAPGSFTMAEDLCRRHICLPVFASMTAEQADYVVASLHEVLQ